MAPRQDRSRPVAVALEYAPGSDSAPRVVASGRDGLAERILRLAFDNDVRVRRDPDLAEVLAAVEVDCEIPVEAFAAVAEILAYVYETNGKMRDALSGGTAGPTG